MGPWAIALGAALCGSGVLAHFSETARRSETGLALGGFCLLLAGLFLTQPPHF